MRMMPTRYIGKAQPVRVKQNTSNVEHLTAPLKGLSLSAKLSTSDPLKASILDNWVIDEDKIRCRPGQRLIYAHPAGDPVSTLVPFYGAPTENMALATSGTLTTYSGVALHTGFLSDDWSWTSFSNLGDQTYTITCNGQDGIWSWSGASLAASLVKEAVTAPTSASWVEPDHMAIVMNHQNHLWFADTENLAIFYLPLQAKSGELAVLPLNAIFKRGGTVRALYSWTVDGGDGMDDKLVVFSSNGECAIYAGTDPDSDYQLQGVYRFDSPMSKNCVVQYGGELHVLISTGLVPMSTLMRAQVEQLGQTDKDVFSMFMDASRRFRGNPGWYAFMDPSTSRIICNLPAGGINHYKQMVRFMPNTYWTSWSTVPARCWGWLNNQLYFGDEKGNLIAMNRSYLDDLGRPILVDVQFAWSNYKTPGVKHFKMLKPYIITDGAPKPAIDMSVDYQDIPPQNQPEITFSAAGASWDDADWDDADWAPPSAMVSKWSGVGRLGTVGAPRLQAQIIGCEFALAGIDVLYEPGSVLG